MDYLDYEVLRLGEEVDGDEEKMITINVTVQQAKTMVIQCAQIMLDYPVEEFPDIMHIKRMKLDLQEALILNMVPDVTDYVFSLYDIHYKK